MRYILGIETSCDETACALVDVRGVVRVNNVSSQIDLHAKFGGVVPEVASRRHIEACLPLVHSTLAEAGVGWEGIAGIAVTRGPGLIGCLLMGVETAKALAWRHEKPLTAVHHLEAHLHAPFLHPSGEGAAHLLLEGGRSLKALPLWLGEGAPPEDVRILEPAYPHIGLIVSGGHTSLVFVEAPGRCEPIAATRDDAVGEAYDKVARLLGLGYPGGPVIAKLAVAGDAARSPFTTPMRRKDELDFSFSGLKSAVARKVGATRREIGEGAALDEGYIRDVCAGFQATVVKTLLDKAIRAARERRTRDLLIVGGVACNRGLRRAAAEAAAHGPRVWFPHPSLCTDNAAMIAGLAWRLAPLEPEEALELNPDSGLPFAGLRAKAALAPVLG